MKIKDILFSEWLRNYRFSEIHELYTEIYKMHGDIREHMEFQIKKRFYVVFNFGSHRSEAIFQQNIKGEYLLAAYYEYTPLNLEYWLGDWVEL